MTKQLEEAIETLRELSDDDQNAVVDVLLVCLSDEARIGNDHAAQV